MKQIKLYDTTLRDGSQSEGISFSVADKIKIAKELDNFGIHYIEGGWPGSNPKDILFFKKVKKIKLKNSRIIAFGSTRRMHKKVEEDLTLKYLLKADTDGIALFGKSWDLHVKCALRTTLGENLKMIYDSIKYLKNKNKEVIYDAEHFFDGYRDNPDYALRSLKEAQRAGADNITLCDTNGGTMPDEMARIVKRVIREIKIPLGIHTHNDADMAVANSIIAVKNGCVLVQGTINGYGERCGNANLCSIIPALKIKMGINCLSDQQMLKLTEMSRYVSEVANVIPHDHQPYVGNSSFTHKAGIHVNAVEKEAKTYEHIEPEKVGNKRRILVSELSGKSNVLFKAKELNIDFTKHSKTVENLLKKIKKLEQDGYQFEGAEGSFELLLRKAARKYSKFFDLEGFKVTIEKDSKGKLSSEAVIKVKVKGVQEHTASEGDGPVNALDNALRKALEKFYPELKEMSLTDFKVRVINAERGTEAKVRVLIESQDKEGVWSTIGVSENVIEASWQALVDSVEYKLLKGTEKK